MQRLCLGTAQWGSDYGLTNARGMIPDEELLDLIRTARSNGIDGVDTAPAYGISEVRVGQMAKKFNVQTKLLCGSRSLSSVLNQFELSLLRLERSHVESVLVHDWSVLDSRSHAVAIESLTEIQESKKTSRVGISVYDEPDLQVAIDSNMEFGVVQLPVSILDQRFDKSPLITELRARGVAIQARSVFLQGAALDYAGKSRWGDHPDVSLLREVANGRSDRMLAACVSYIQTRSWIDEVVLGVTSANELRNILSYFESEPLEINFAEIASSDEVLIDPRKW